MYWMPFTSHGIFVGHNSDITWASWYLNSPQLIIQQFVQANNNVSTNVSHYWPIVRIHGWLFDHLHKSKYCVECFHVMTSSWMWGKLSVCLQPLSDLHRELPIETCKKANRKKSFEIDHLPLSYCDCYWKKFIRISNNSWYRDSSD